MRTTVLRLALLLAAALPLAGAAMDAPHDASSTTAVNCQSCHRGHNAPGAALTTQAGNATLCFSCHTTGTAYVAFATKQANLAASTGTSHSWSGAAVNATLGTAVPADAEMSKRLGAASSLQCSTCHDQHNGALAFRGTVHTSVALASNILRTAGTGTGTLQLTAVPAATARPAGYTIKVGASATTFQISHDRGLTYLNWNAGAWTTALPVAGKPFVSGTPVALDDGVTTVTFSGTFLTTDVFTSFYVSFPFLRLSNAADAMCLQCHGNRNFNHVQVEGPNTTYATVYSHPVNVVLNANGLGYDAAVPRDADGSANDLNTSNDLLRNGDTTVGCTSCHAVHNADSNSLTVDPH